MYVIMNICEFVSYDRASIWATPSDLLASAADHELGQSKGVDSAPSCTLKSHERSKRNTTAALMAVVEARWTSCAPLLRITMHWCATIQM